MLTETGLADTAAPWSLATATRVEVPTGSPGRLFGAVYGSEIGLESDAGGAITVDLESWSSLGQPEVPAGTDLLLVARQAVNRWDSQELNEKFIGACRRLQPAKDA